MNPATESRVRDLERRLANILRVGTVKTLDAAKARITVQIGDLLTGPIPWIAPRAGGDRSWWAPEPGEQVMIMAPGGELSLGVAIPAIYQTAYPAPANAATVHRTTYADGTVIEYDRATHKLKAAVAGSIEATATGTASISATGNVSVGSSGKITLAAGTVEIVGNATISGNLTMPNGDVFLQTISVRHHKHDAVQPGPSLTGEPQPI